MALSSHKTYTSLSLMPTIWKLSLITLKSPYQSANLKIMQLGCNSKTRNNVSP